MSRLEGGCVIYKGQSEAVIYARYLPGSVRSRVIYIGRLHSEVVVIVSVCPMRGQSVARVTDEGSVRS